MSSHSALQHRKKLAVVVFGKKNDFMMMIGNLISDNKAQFVQKLNGFALGENDKVKITITPDFFDEECLCPDQYIIDCMALSTPGPSIFILAVESQNCQQQKVVSQIIKLESMFGDNITKHLAVITHNVEIYNSLRSLETHFPNIHVATASENLYSVCQDWCLGRWPFLYHYENYSEAVVTRRRPELEITSNGSSSVFHSLGAYFNPPTPSSSQNTPAETADEDEMGVSAAVEDGVFSIILLGKAGTGKSASANTILMTLKPHLGSKYPFTSKLCSMPVTTKCDVRIIKKSKKLITVVDTPDFFNNKLENSQEQIEECQKYCQPGRCVVLLVIQLGRFTEGEIGILEKLENTFGWKIRESTVVLFTHGEDFKSNLDTFIREQPHLRHILEACKYRCHVFKNTSNNPEQVRQLVKKFPNYKNFFSKSGAKCNLC